MTFLFLQWRIKGGNLNILPLRKSNKEDDFSEGKIHIVAPFDPCHKAMHTVAIWTFTFHKKQAVCSWFVRPISNEPRGQTIQLFDLKIQMYYTHFSSIFCRSCQIHCFLHTVTAVPRSWNIGVVIWHKNMTQIDQSFCNSSDSVQN